MRESIANVFVINFIIVFVIIFIGLFATSSSYSKASKVKNMVLDIVEEHADELGEVDTLPDDIENEIETSLSRLGYRLNKNQNNKCKKIDGAILMNGFSNYHYCVYKHPKAEDNTIYNGNAPRRGNYFTVITYMYFDIPLIGSNLELAVQGETRTYFEEVKYNG